MTQEEKELLLKDLCARLPYGVKVKYYRDNCDGTINTINFKFKTVWITAETGSNDSLDFESIGNGIWQLKPYLRPMSSMTEEEGKELEHIFCEIDAPCWVDTEYGCVNFAGGNDFIDTEIAEVYTDWLNKKMFDYRGLIQRGLALEAPKDMYKTE